ncbi:nicotinamide riboside transporter PnuC [Acetobacter lambici]|uniref:Nicotinamide riboside transporter PnuC n=1 Tax=Acetobacter lambici TaxID=1332824 RepID=A0ABT1F275_9PROT|nr:nicotinamide riboside transporter PnuC [Acetobacter lambici]MCP1243330.1 nicotinamide riboside transporter PnuC [Acetobacter lambici]MCP1259295.1 nicotinamide riboside transporter PnuC [Acetobacter lambici]NHO57520.1 nicotinamide riboside transporter PnuC [Acetobacter lambici]
MPSLEATAVIINIVAVWLTAQRSMLCWPVGMVGALLYLRQFYIWHLYGDMLLQGVYMMILAYGWYSWRKTATNENEARSSPPIPAHLLIHAVLAACVALPLGWGFARFTDDPQPYLDSLLMCLSLLASVWTTRKYRENWYLWIIVDTAYAALFLYRQDLLTSGLYAMFTLLAVYGTYKWSTK